jgi:hypothetical protein
MSGVMNPGRRDVGLLATVMKGLQIARDVYGIRASQAQLDAHEADQKAAQQRSDGVLTPGDEVSMFQKGFVQATEKDPGAFAYKDGGGLVKYAAKAQESQMTPLQKVTTVENGKKVEKFVRPSEGQTFEQPPEAPQGQITSADRVKGFDANARALRDDLKPYQEAVNAAKDAKNLGELARTNPTATAPFLRRLARAAGERGVLTESDVNAFGGSQAMFSRLERAASSASSGLLPPEDIDYALKVAAAMEESSQAGIESMTKDATESVTRNWGGTFDDNYYRLTGRKPGKAIANQSSPPLVTQSPSNQPKSPPPLSVGGKPGPGSTVEIEGRRFRVLADGDSLEEIKATGAN